MEQVVVSDDASVELGETVTYLVNENGDVVCDITQTLSTIMEDQQDGNIVFIAMDQSSASEEQGVSDTCPIENCVTSQLKPILARDQVFYIFLLCSNDFDVLLLTFFFASYFSKYPQLNTVQMTKTSRFIRTHLS